MHRDFSTAGRIFQGVAQDVEVNLTEFGDIAEDVHVLDFGRTGEGDTLLLHLRFEDGIEGVVELIEVHELLVQCGLAAFYACHLQHVVDEREQELVGCLNLVQVVPGQFLVIEVFLEQVREPHDGIHGRTDVMAHVEEKVRLGLVGCLGNGQRRLGLSLTMGLGDITSQDVHHGFVVLVGIDEEGELMPLVFPLVGVAYGHLEGTDIPFHSGHLLDVVEGEDVHVALQVVGMDGLVQAVDDDLIIHVPLHLAENFLHTGSLDEPVLTGEDVNSEIETIESFGKVRHGMVGLLCLIAQVYVVGNVPVPAYGVGHTVLLAQ